MKYFVKILANVITAVALATGLQGCGSDEEDTHQQQLADRAALSDILRLDDDLVNPFLECLDSMPDGGRKMHINYLGGYLATVFNDSNYLHLDAAQRCGRRPIVSLADLWQPEVPLKRVATCQNYYVDNLTHSLPYLTVDAATLLDDIGRAFRDSLAARGGGDYRIKVTSVMRTPSKVRQLRRRNVNAVDGSTHLYATTFDISYAKFICDNDSMPRTQEDLKNLLGEVLFDLKQANRCYIKYERKQACFHITVRPPM